MATITHAGITIAPTLILGYQTSSMVEPVEHVLLNGDVRYTLRPARPRSGTLNLFFATEQKAWEAFALHRQAGTFDLDDNDIPAVSMLYLVAGDLSIGLDPETRARWLLNVPYKEIVG